MNIPTYTQKKKVLLFDFDGTLVDSFAAITNTLDNLADEFGYSRLANMEILRQKPIKDIIKDLNIPFIKLPGLIKRARADLKKQIPLLDPIASIIEVLETLKNSGFSMAIITSNTVENVDLFLKNHNITVFDTVYSDNSFFGKYKVINRFLKKFNIAQKDAIYIGDEIRDIEASYKSGIQVIAVTWGFNSKEILEQYKPDFLVSTPAELLEVIENL